MPVVTKAGQGSPNDYNLDDCLAWLKKNGKGQSVRVDRPGAATRVNALTQTTGNNSAPPDGDYLKLTGQEVMDAMTFGVKQGQAQAFEWVAENFLVAAASLIRVGGIDPELAVNLGFHIAHSFRSAGCMVEEVEQKDYDPESRAARWLKGDKETLAEFAALAVEMQTLWHKK